MSGSTNSGSDDEDSASGNHPAAAAITTDAFKDAFRNHAAGVAVITADAGQGPVALTATSVFSASVEPPVLAFSVSSFSSSTPTILAAETVVVHLLTSEQLHIAKLGATSGIDRFADTSLWTRLATGEPYFPAADNWIRARITNKMTAGGGTIISAEALESKPRPAEIEAETKSRRPLVYHDRTWYHLGDHAKLD
jgi:flavin reductase (DIM6/NTAB) family NADH-FMN oxidoreductase RutF